MDLGQFFWISVGSRILHVGTAIALVGGAFFLRCVLLPAVAQSLDEATHARLRGAVLARWKYVIHGGITLLLVTGGYNYLRVILEGSHKGDGLYHALVGIKILLAMGVFFIASVLVGRAPAFERLRAKAGVWLVVNLLLALAIVAISGFLRVRGAPAGSGQRAASARISQPAPTFAHWTAPPARTPAARFVSVHGC